MMKKSKCGFHVYELIAIFCLFCLFYFVNEISDQIRYDMP